MPAPPILVRSLGRIDYMSAWRAMVDFTAARGVATPDELWLCEHPPIYTLGQAGKPEHRLVDNGIPLVKVDRGGQITYHGPGQVVVYPLLDLKRRGLGPRAWVGCLEQAVIDLLAEHGVAARRLEGAPGVYVGCGDAARPAKIAALGLRIRRACSYHGLSLNVDMELAPFSAINPCGHAGMPVTQTRDLGIGLTPAQAGEALVRQLLLQLLRQLESP
ncbi:MAG: lipoyl(octanoyl) transferase LipB [Candidatus Accumulibacter sp.]|jgi:lipoyl(octanoyl) transferase|nr:lipoyl(octanoyl) transferase LipB [Accumulibacter sp.]